MGLTPPPPVYAKPLVRTMCAKGPDALPAACRVDPLFITGVRVHPQSLPAALALNNEARQRISLDPHLYSQTPLFILLRGLTEDETAGLKEGYEVCPSHQRAAPGHLSDSGPGRP